MKILIVCDESILIPLKAILDMKGHDARGVAAKWHPLWGAVSYSPLLEKRILDEADALQPDWVLMVLQGGITRQIDTLGKICKLTRARLYLLSGGNPQEVEVERALGELGLSFQFALMPVDIDDMLNVLATEKQ